MEAPPTRLKDGISPRGVSWDQRPMSDAVESRGDHGTPFSSSAVDITPVAVRVPAAEKLDGVGVDALGCCPRHCSVSEGMASILSRVEAETGNGEAQVVEESCSREWPVPILEAKERRRCVSTWWAEEA